MHPDVRHMFSSKKYGSQIDLILEEKAYLWLDFSIGPKSVTFRGDIKLPFGNVVPELYFHRRDPKDPDSFRSEKVKDVELKQ